MSFLTAFTANIWAILSYALPFLFLLCVVVFIHELGHFLAGRMCGVKVKSFSVGFGPEILGFTDKYGTRWKFSAIPLGGYVKFHGDLNAASVPDNGAAQAMSDEEKKYSFPHKSVGQRAFIVAAGPLANFILSIAIFATIALLFGRMALMPVIGSVLPGSVAEKAGLMAGDRILSINSQPIPTFEALQRTVSISQGEALQIVLERGGQRVTATATPEQHVSKGRLGIARMGRLGITASNDPQNLQKLTFNPLTALSYGAYETWYVVERTMAYVGKLLVGRENADQLSGLPRIVQASGEITQTSGFVGLLGLTALMSVSIGLLNLFPIPLLDGGHLLFYAFEAIRRKPLPERVQEVGFKIGFALVIALMVFATWNDILHFVSL
jgi:regulator of sigma E protease